jgi:multidrug resistance efflux pump
MRAVVLVAASLLAAPLPVVSAESPAMRRALEEVERLRKLVDAGAAPRLKLEEAERALAAARDEEVLERTLYGAVGVEELTEEQSAEMVAAARRALERQTRRLEDSKRLVEEGAMPRTALTAVLQDFDRAKKTVDMAESRARLFAELMAMARAEVEAEAAAHNQPGEAPEREAVLRFGGSGVFTSSQFKKLAAAFQKQFGRALPVSANGDTAFHRSLGFDHRGRVDVALHPDREEGEWLLRFLEAERIPYFAFRRSVPGSATGAHIHIGPPSARLRMAD